MDLEFLLIFEGFVSRICYSVIFSPFFWRGMYIGFGRVEEERF